MWIQLTDGDGKPIAFNAEQLIAMMEHGDRTLVVYQGGQVVVAERQAEILAALRLRETNGRSVQPGATRPQRLV